MLLYLVIEYMGRLYNFYILEYKEFMSGNLRFIKKKKNCKITLISSSLRHFI